MLCGYGIVNAYVPTSGIVLRDFGCVRVDASLYLGCRVYRFFGCAFEGVGYWY